MITNTSLITNNHMETRSDQSYDTQSTTIEKISSVFAKTQATRNFFANSEISPSELNYSIPPVTVSESNEIDRKMFELQESQFRQSISDNEMQIRNDLQKDIIIMAHEPNLIPYHIAGFHITYMTTKEDHNGQWPKPQNVTAAPDAKLDSKTNGTAQDDLSDIDNTQLDDAFNVEASAVPVELVIKDIPKAFTYDSDSDNDEIQVEPQSKETVKMINDWLKTLNR